MSLMRPNAKVTTTGGAPSALPAAVTSLVPSAGALGAAAAALASVEVHLQADGRHDSVRMVVHGVSRLATLKVGQTVGLALGDIGAEVDLFAGVVERIAQARDGLVIDALSATVALSRSRRSQTYVDQTVADIVRDLAKPAAVDEVQGDLTLAAYTVDDRRSVWDQLQDLAALIGAEVSSAHDGGLRFVPVEAQGSADHTLSFGRDLLAYEVARLAPVAPARVAALADRSRGEWHWLARQPVPSGADPGAARLVAAFRTRAAADGLAQSLVDRAARARWAGRLRLRGSPRIRPGQRIELTDLPGEAIDLLRVRGVEHRLSADDGFLTELIVEGGGAASGGLLDMVGGLL